VQLKIGETYKDQFGTTWEILYKFPSGAFVGVHCAREEEGEDRIHKFSNTGYGGGFTSMQLKEIEKEYFGVEVTVDNQRRLVNGTWAKKADAEKQANEMWWKYQPKVVQLHIEEIK